MGDFLRLSLSAADPMVLGILYAAMHDMLGIQVISTKNKYLGSMEDIKKTGSPSVLVNLQVDVPGLPQCISEVQLYVDNFLSLKKSQHKTYEITRANKLSDLMMPIYRPELKDLIRHSASLNSAVEEFDWAAEAEMDQLDVMSERL